MIAAGVGCRRGVAAEDIVEAVFKALGEGHSLADIDVIATLDDKAAEPGLTAAARRLAKPVVALSYTALAAMASDAKTRSARVAAEKALPSVAETAALAAAGRNARLIAPRSTAGGATCALAEGDGQ